MFLAGLEFLSSGRASQAPDGFMVGFSMPLVALKSGLGEL
jgi:hypothetical protein